MLISGDILPFLLIISMQAITGRVCSFTGHAYLKKGKGIEFA
jgi:hypothetical protein